MFQQVLYGDILYGIVVSESKFENSSSSENLVLKVKFAVIFQLHDGRRGDGFRDAGNAEQVIRINAGSKLCVGITESLCKNQSVILHNSEGETRNLIRVHMRFDLRIDCREIVVSHFIVLPNHGVAVTVQ